MPKLQPIAKAEMLIRKPVAEVFEAFVDLAITPKFWFTKASGRLEPGKQIGGIGNVRVVHAGECKDH